MLCLMRHPVLRKDKMKRAPRFKVGSIVFDRRRKIWNFLTWEVGKRRTRRIGTLSEFPSKSAARRAAQVIQIPPVSAIPKPQPKAATIRTLVEQYRAEKMPRRHDTRQGYESWLRVYILPQWDGSAITDLQARPVEMWLDSLSLAPKSKVHIRGILSALWNYTMWRQDIPMQVNPISLVTVKGASKRIRQPRTLTVEQFRLLVSHLREPFKTLALMCACFGLRISEALALQWSDVDWLNELCESSAASCSRLWTM
jgi:integrase